MDVDEDDAGDSGEAPDESVYDEEEDADRFEEEGGWEPQPCHEEEDGRPFGAEDGPGETDGVFHGPISHEAQQRVHAHLRAKTFVVPFPGHHAGKAGNQDREPSAYEKYARRTSADSPYYPFVSKLDWEVARWAKMRGPGSTAVTELLEINDLVRLLGLSFKNSGELNRIIDNDLTSGRPRFTRREVIVAGQAFEVFYRDVIACVRALYGDPEFAGILVFTPERHYADGDHTVRVYFDMHTGRWWWDTQAAIEKRRPGATIIPIIISSDKTQLTVFGSKTAYPVYMTIGNLPKDVRRKPNRRGQILLAYLPSSRLEHITNKAARRRVQANLFHTCMSMILKPLRQAGIHGISITSGDGITRRGHPIFAMYIGDYPEQLLVTCCKTGTCPKCEVPREELGQTTNPDRPLRDRDKVRGVLEKADESDADFSRACREIGLKPIRAPFWHGLPFVDIFRSITPDILHQLYQGVMKHLLAWLRNAYGADELDARCRRLPPNHQIRLFLKGVTTLHKVTGKEHGDICRFMLALIINLPLHDGMSSVRLVRAVRSLLDFLYLARYPAHTSETLAALRSSLAQFHANKAIFIDLGIRLHFKLPKLHSLDHYPLSIKLFGTTDNYDTQYTERLHIDFAKDAYRATNHRDEFPQMTVWLERREKILRHDAYIRWRLRSDAGRVVVTYPSSSSADFTVPPAFTRIKMTKNPSVKALRFDAAINLYGATWIRDALARYIVGYRNPSLTPAEVEREALTITYRFQTLLAYHKIKFVLEDAQQLGIMEATDDAAHARPARYDRQGRPVPGRFDTVLVSDGTGGPSGVQGYHVGRLRLVFSLSDTACKQLIPDVIDPGPLAYVEWFTQFTQPNPIHGLYKVSRERDRQRSLVASVVEVKNIRRSCHLFPAVNRRDGIIPRDWTSSTVLDSCEDFWVNRYSDMHMYMTFF
ncbi:hypothetical protein L226DRAFT_467289 [Lentinus tigrinus ALCF2SS1-7]|uniref:Uncharacterized protein n=1 Tax=Lentinus tigrinus ALCF2SS1-6 TaxID=1328759 RepID=A0A5C2S3P7_9APHY|nr:hypothetical protein L227DRAFT_505826 [Lentinus tigrinus ALCF2SS1-6]RPD72206.1 hypothetical protein L226DRAFT_467289 [Lentinus tigrinus ALCF2SS1-7]